MVANGRRVSKTIRDREFFVKIASLAHNGLEQGSIFSDGIMSCTEFTRYWTVPVIRLSGATNGSSRKRIAKALFGNIAQ